MPDNPGGLVYGTILVAALLAAESPSAETYIKTAGGIVVVLGVYWIALAYSEFTGERVENGERFEYVAFARHAKRQLSVVYGAAVPLLALLICWAVGATLNTGVNVAIWTAAAMIVAIEILLAIRTDLRGADLVRQAAVGVLLGLLVTALRVLLH